MCSDEQHNENMAALECIRKLLTYRQPTDQLIMISDYQGWPMDYKGYKHVFMWSPQAINLNLGDYGTGPIQPQIWVNLGIKTGIKIFTSGQGAAAIPVMLRFTDEIIP